MPEPTPNPLLRVIVGRRLAWISGLFVLVVALILSANAYLLRTVDPLQSPALHALRAQLAQAPENDTLRQQVRELDLLARRAFFTRQWQLESGAWLLAGGALVWVLSLNLMVWGHKRLPDLKACPGVDHPWAAATRARRIIAVGALTLPVAGGLLLALWVRPFALPSDAAPPSAPHPPAAVSDVSSPPPSPPPAPSPPEAIAAEPIPAFAWPSFRGQHGHGHAAHDADPPLDWDGATGRNIRWKRAVPRSGFSSPIVWDDRVYLTGADADRRELYALDADTGELLWTADAEGVPGAPDTPPRVTDDTGYAAATPATDGQRIAAIFGTGVILCVDRDGRRLWTRSLGVPDNPYGHSSSLLIDGELLLVQFDHFDGAEVLALELETGETRWVTVRMADTSWASPILVDTDAGRRLILKAAPMVAAYDVRTGAEVWSVDCMSGEIGASPAYADGRIFAANQYSQAVALDAASGELLWDSMRLELPDAGSPVARGDRLYLPTSYGAFSCVDATDGSLIWEHDFDEGGYGSPILAGDRLYWTTAAGVTHIFRAADAFELLAEPALGEPSTGTPVMVGNRLYLRGETHLFCIESP